MRLFIAAAMLAGTVAATPAFAQDADAPAGKQFQGLKVLALGGVDDVVTDGSDTVGALYAGTVGYDFQAGKLVFGVEGEFGGSTAKECERDLIVTGDRTCLKAGRDIYGGARAGVVIRDNTLLYIKGGYTNGRAVATYDSGTTNTKLGANLDGWRAGVGFEFNTGSRFVVRTEYRYSDYEQGVSRHQGVVGLGVKF